MNKIAIIGSPGSGKTTLSARLSEITLLPTFHLDKIMWTQNYVPIAYSDFLSAQKKIIEKRFWILDGNFTNSVPLRIESADAIIFLDFPWQVCIWRLIKRYVRFFGYERPDMGGGNKENLGPKLLWFVYRYPTHEINSMLDNASKRVQIYIVRNNYQLSELIAKFRNEFASVQNSSSLK